MKLRSLVRFLLCVCLVCYTIGLVAGCSRSQSTDADLVGIWSVSGKTTLGPGDLTIELKADGTSLHGVKGSDGQPDFTTGGDWLIEGPGKLHIATSAAPEGTTFDYTVQGDDLTLSPNSPQQNVWKRIRQ